MTPAGKFWIAYFIILIVIAIAGCGGGTAPCGYTALQTQEQIDTCAESAS